MLMLFVTESISHASPRCLTSGPISTLLEMLLPNSAEVDGITKSFSMLVIAEVDSYQDAMVHTNECAM